MKKFLIYKCNKCYKEKIINNSNTNIFINLCDLTPNCTGRLALLDETSLKDISNNSLIENSNGIIIEDKQEKFYNLTTGPNNELVIISSTNAPEIKVKFLVNNDLTINNVEYVYHILNTTSELLGPDSSSSRKTLTFNTTNDVKIIVNGEEKINVIDYQLIFHNNIGYKITFTNQLPINGIVTVIVSPKQVLTYSPEIIFKRNEIIISESNWENIYSILINNNEYYLYTCYNVNDIPKKSKLTILEENIEGGYNCSFLLTKSNYSKLNRNYNIIVPLVNCNLKNNVGIEYSEFNSVNLYLPIQFKNYDYTKEIIIDDKIIFEQYQKNNLILSEV